MAHWLWEPLLVMRTSEQSMCTLRLQRRGDSCRGAVSWGPLHRLCGLQREREKPKASVHTHTQAHVCTHAHTHTHCSLESPDVATVPDNPHCHPSPSLGTEMQPGVLKSSGPGFSLDPQRMTWPREVRKLIHSHTATVCQVESQT